jgi:hypothetical protein
MSAFGQKRTLMRFAISALSLVGRESPFARSSDHENIAGKIEPPGEKLRNVMAASKRSTSIVRPTANAVNQSRLGNASFFPSVALRSHRYCPACFTVLERLRTHCRVADGVRDAGVAQEVLQPPSVHAFGGQGVAGRMPDHVDVNSEW